MPLAEPFYLIISTSLLLAAFKAPGDEIATSAVNFFSIFGPSFSDPNSLPWTNCHPLSDLVVLNSAVL